MLRECYFEGGSVMFGTPVIRFEDVHVQSLHIEFEDVVSSVEGLHSLTFGRVSGARPNIQHSACIQDRSRRAIDECIEDGSGVGELEFRKKLNKMLLNGFEGIDGQSMRAMERSFRLVR
ncbi:MAG: hypothetical protein IPN01_26900 [Deltaproteobacteria bacterium]|nr:hypothetical protein [Deltaproteobacteria bacterium]